MKRKAKTRNKWRQFKSNRCTPELWSESTCIRNRGMYLLTMFLNALVDESMILFLENLMWLLVALIIETFALQLSLASGTVSFEVAPPPWSETVWGVRSSLGIISHPPRIVLWSRIRSNIFVTPQVWEVCCWNSSFGRKEMNDVGAVKFINWPIHFQ